MSDMTALLPRAATLIGDGWVDDGAGGQYEHVNAATGQPQGLVPLAGPRDVDEAVAAARQALPAWRSWPADRRRDVLLRITGLLRDHRDELAEILILEGGMIATQARGVSSGGVAEFFAYYAGWAEKIEGAVVPAYPGPALDYTLVEPFGVVGVIIPWNGPLTPIGMKVAPALAAGNAVVIKPSELAPFSTIRFAELCLEAGLPPGVVNIVVGGPEAGNHLVRHPGVDKISFTGGPVTAAQVMTAASENLTPLVLELGGKSANLVFADADLPAATGFAAMAPMMRSGQACILPTRLLVEESVYDEVLAGVTKVVGSIRVGDPFDEATQMGPVISAGHCARVEAVIDRAIKAGSGELMTGGQRLGGDLAAGYFIAPTVFGGVDNSSDLAQHEIFGPVLSVLPFSCEDEGIALANDTRYGLGACVWTNDLKRAHRVARALEAGSVSINTLAVPTNAPFGGVKASGFGREGGRAGLDEFLRPKNVYVQL
jgi:aldehyde dehydrogenase (NAD+)